MTHRYHFPAFKIFSFALVVRAQESKHFRTFGETLKRDNEGIKRT